MGRQFRQLRAAIEIPLLRNLPADEPALHLHGGLAARARALLSARRHACGGRLVPAGRARARAFEAVLLELSAAGVGPDQHIEAGNAYYRNSTQPLSNYKFGCDTCHTRSLASSADKKAKMPRLIGLVRSRQSRSRAFNDAPRLCTRLTGALPKSAWPSCADFVVKGRSDV